MPDLGWLSISIHSITCHSKIDPYLTIIFNKFLLKKQILPKGFQNLENLAPNHHFVGKKKQECQIQQDHLIKNFSKTSLQHGTTMPIQSHQVHSIASFYLSNEYFSNISNSLIFLHLRHLNNFGRIFFRLLCKYHTTMRRG